MMIILMTNQMFFVMVLDYSDFVLVVSTPLLFLLKGKGDFPPSHLISHLSRVQIVMVQTELE